MYKAIVVDDEEMIRNGIKNVIPWESLGVSEVITASSVNEAINIMKSNNFDIMITDICMPEKDGLSLVKEVNDINSALKIIVLTGFDNFEYAQKCCKMKVNDFLLKPIDEDELTDVIRNLIKELDEEREKLQNQKKILRVEGTEEQIKLESIMQNIICNKSSYEDINKILSEYNLCIEYKYRVMILSPILDDNLSWKNHFKLLNLSIKKVCIEIFDCNNDGITFEDINKNIVIIIFIRNDSSYKNKIKFLIQYLKEEYDIKQKYVLGSIVNNIRKIDISYNDGYRKINNNDINSSGEYEKKMKEFNYSIYNIKQFISENINNLDLVVKEYDKFIELIDSYNLSIGLVRKYCFDIVTTIYFAYISEFESKNDDSINSLAVSLQGLKKEDAIKVIRNFIIQMYGLEEGENREIIIEAKRYIKNNLDKAISVCNIAERLYVNPTYFSRLFKNSTGEGCNNYIVRKKIEKAKELLKTTTMKIGKIADIVGYKDTNYFSLTFKKQTGLTPKEFREVNS